MNILNSANTAATINKIIHNSQGTTKTSEGATAAGKIIKENLPDIISAGFDMPHPTSIFEGVPPFSFISNGDPLVNWSIYGNTVEGVSVGTQTNNKFDISLLSFTEGGSLTIEDTTVTMTGNAVANVYYLNSQEYLAGTYTFSFDRDTTTNCYYVIASDYEVDNCQLDGSALIISAAIASRLNKSYAGYKGTAKKSFTIISDVPFYLIIAPISTTYTISNIILNTGDTAKPYEPYGYKIPIVCGGVTTNIYIDEPLTSGETISYNDTGVIIPTRTFLNTLSVGTTVQPAKVFIEYVK